MLNSDQPLAPPASSRSYSLTIDSVTFDGEPIHGLPVMIMSHGTIASSGATPLTFVAIAGNYTISVSNEGSSVFYHWSDGTMSNVRELTLTENTILAAYYQSNATQTTAADWARIPG
jgi:hypothetical protein